VVNERSKVSNSDGSKMRLETMATNNVIETSMPKALVPPKVEILKIENPKKSTIDV